MNDITQQDRTAARGLCLILASLLEVTHYEGTVFNSGICDLIEDSMYSERCVMLFDPECQLWHTHAKEAFKVWPLYSGERHWPVIDPADSGTPEEQFIKHFHNNTMWTGEQRRLRKDLLNHLFNYFYDMTGETE